MIKDTSAKIIFEIFASYGFRKTSMDDLAKAFGISRQALYKRHKSKDAVFRWMVQEIILMINSESEIILKNTQTPISERLLNVFDQTTGAFVDTLTTSPHGIEMLDMLYELAAEDTEKSKQDLGQMIADALLRADLVKDAEHAENIAFTLSYASKGLMVASQNRDAYNEGMKRVITTLMHD